jgi:uncharacterized membrane protein
VVGVVLVIVAAFGVLSRINGWPTVTDHPLAYWLPWGMAVALWVLGTYGFTQHREWFYENAHGYAAMTLFAYIIVVVVNIGLQKKRGEDGDTKLASRPWAAFYFVLAALMFVGAVLIYLLVKPISDNPDTHRIFFVEGWLIFWLAVFWLTQTWDRRNDGAPRTNQEQQRTTGTATS